MFTKNELVESWLIKLFSEGGHADIQPNLGGGYELFWDPERKEQNSTLGCKITAIVPDRILAFDWKGPVDFEKFMNIDPLTHVVVSFFSNRDGSTDVHLIHSGWGNSSQWDAAREYFKKGWASAFQNLEYIVRGN
jgi:uncharacterized protein YndB with AHSA1/START domain